MGDEHYTPDTTRQDRIGFDEAVFCAGKSAAQIDAIVARALSDGASALLTRLSTDKHAALQSRTRSELDYEPLSESAVLGDPRPLADRARIAVVCAGTSDAPVAREAARTLAYYGEPCLEVYDVGVAGLWRLLDRIEELRAMRIVIAAAGMDAALPSVIGGQVPGAVIAVPTSVGYGVAAGGETALRATLASCAPGVVVVNIDNGYGAACAALRILRADE